MSKLRQLAIEIFIHSIESLLEFFLSELADRVVRGIVVDIWKQDGLRKWRLNVLARAAISVTASSNLKVGNLVSEGEKRRKVGTNFIVE